MYEGDTGNLDAIFPSDGVIRIRKKPPALKGEKSDEINKKLGKFKVPIMKQRVILKPKKLKLPANYNLLDEETFSDVMYDSENDKKKSAKKR